jgi:signal transduction histidine kinase
LGEILSWTQIIVLSHYASQQLRDDFIRWGFKGFDTLHANSSSARESLLSMTVLTGKYNATSDLQLRGLWLHVARAVWLGVAGLTLLVFIVSAIHVYQFYLEPCATWTIDKSCGRVIVWLNAQGINVKWLAFYNLMTVILVGLPWMTVACLVFARRGSHLSGWVLSLALLTGWASDLTNVNVRHHFWWAVESWGWASQLGYFPHVVVYLVSFVSQVMVVMLGYLLPNGRFVPRWTFQFALAWAAYMVLETFYRYPFFTPAPQWFSYPETFFTFAAPLIAVYAVGYRYREIKRSLATGTEVNKGLDEQKRQLETILPSILTLTLVYSVLTFMLFLLWRQPAPWADKSIIRYVHDNLQNGLQAACAVWFIFSLSVAVFRHQLFALELFVSRALVYSGLSVGLFALYLGVVVGVGSLLHQRQAFWLPLLATALIALLFQPLREQLQKRVDYFLYGQRAEPYEVMHQVGRQQQVLQPQDLLPALVQTLHQTLRLPYVAITLHESPFSQGSRTMKEGVPGKHVTRFPLVAREELGIQEELGVLEVSPRSYETFSASEEKLLGSIARQIALSARSLYLSRALQASRETLVTTREEERRRLRRDLHDGLGPTLAAQTLKVGVARSLLRDNPSVADDLLKNLEQDIQGTLGAIRQLVYSLRPPLLDQFGLKAALEYTLRERLQGQATELHLHLSDVPSLPAAVEVASYFIITEAVNNVLHHAKAKTCDISMSRVADGLELVIRDDGQGLRVSQGLAATGKAREGVGLSSMRERCEEVGGKFKVTSERGTTVWALLPVQFVKATSRAET